MSIRIVYNDGHSEDSEQDYGDAIHNALFVAPRNIDWGRTDIDRVRLDGMPLAIAKRGHVFYLLKLESGRAMVAAGCRYMSIPEYRAHVAREYPGTDKATKTLRILDFFEALARDAQCTGLGEEQAHQQRPLRRPSENNRRCPNCGGRTEILPRGDIPEQRRIYCAEANSCRWGHGEYHCTVAQYDTHARMKAQTTPDLQGLDSRPLSEAVHPIPHPAPPPPLGPYDTEKARAMRQENPGYFAPDIACPECGGAPVSAERTACSAHNNNHCHYRATNLDEVRARWDQKRAAGDGEQELYDVVIAPPQRTNITVAEVMELLNSNPKIERISNRLDNMQRLIEGLCDHLGVR